MQLALRPYATAGVAVVSAGLIYVTPVVAPNIEQRAVHLAAAETLSELVGPVDAVVNSLGGLGGELSSLLPNPGDLSGTFADPASSLPADISEITTVLGQLWQQFYDAVMPIVGPILLTADIFLGGLILYADWFTETYLGFPLLPSLGAAVEPAAIADIGTAVDAGTIADLGGMLTSLIP